MGAARRATWALAEVIREQTLAATTGRTYAETGEYLAADGPSTSDATKAVLDEVTGSPARNRGVDLLFQSMTLQTALMQAFMAFRVSDLMVALGGALAPASAGIAAAARR